MFKKYWALLGRTGISPYIWTILGILPFYFIYLSSSTVKVMAGIVLTLAFFALYRLAYISKGWTVYLWTLLLIGISIALTTLFSYVYFAFFIAYFIGNIKKKIPFYVLYSIHLAGMVVAINLKIILKDDFFLRQLPLVVIVLLSLILLPFSLRHRSEKGRLEEKLDDANKRIGELIKIEERQRIARDLHDTLGQKLSLIGLKSDLARRLISKDPDRAAAEMVDVQQTARTALNEVRKMVSQMRGIRLSEEILRVQEMLAAAQIEYKGSKDWSLPNVPLLVENILSMCLKEAVTNVVRHSSATRCEVKLARSKRGITLIVKDNGVGKVDKVHFAKGSGLSGMRERLDFVNGTLDIMSDGGTELVIWVPTVVQHMEKEGAE
ncbi:sensor histidine kinase [Neobacillus notoginsengisoli]|uniref:histidine kinase n=1 Tax=Neobacillus notoginsengisoli TaxID=1578198 RepID=A0A417YX11_9BACI|nr:sensor histidine kinase [Neobacillus notoginsengisoli]RHW42028.1 sensor histidine kinase [Neobacillus notoginsengisoli]